MRDSERRAKRLTNKLQLFSEDSRSTFHCAVLKVRSARKAGSEAKARQARAGQAEAERLTERPEKAVREGSQTGKTDRKPTRAQTLYNSGDDSKREPPVPIPNTEVKPLSAEGTWLATAREIRTPPDSTEGISNYPLHSN